VLRCDPFTQRGAASILKVDAEAEETQVKNALEKVKSLVVKAAVKEADAEARRALEALTTAEETLRFARQGGAPAAAAERLLAEGVSGSGLLALGLRDLRGIGGKAAVRAASWRVGEAIRVALCCGATAELGLAELGATAKVCQWQPKVAALQWANKALALESRQDTSASAICVCVRERLEEDGEAGIIDDLFAASRPAKRQKGMPGPRSVRVRHLLLRCAEAGKSLPDDPMARRPRAAARGNQAAGAQRTPAEAEAELVKMLDGLLRMGEQGSASEGELENQRLVAFRKLCQQHSECSTADNAGQLCGDLGWVSRGQGEPTFEQAAFTLRKGEFSDVITTSRGMHLIQRLG